jgi:hypothetical protein
MISMPAIDPATATLLVMNQLIANISSVPRVRQLTAFRTDLACVSAPRNKITRCASLELLARAYHVGRGSRRAAFHARNAKIAQPAMDRLRDYVHFALRNQTNPLIGLNSIEGNDADSISAEAGHRCEIMDAK